MRDIFSINCAGRHKMSIETKRACIKVASLRPNYRSFEEWLADPNNVYVGRAGRIFITDVKGESARIFHYKNSLFANPYAVKDHGLDTCLYMYRERLKSEIRDPRILEELHKLKGKTLGCFCNLNEPCHVDIIIDAIDALFP